VSISHVRYTSTDWQFTALKQQVPRKNWRQGPKVRFSLIAYLTNLRVVPHGISSPHIWPWSAFPHYTWYRIRGLELQGRKNRMDRFLKKKSVNQTLEPPTAWFSHFHPWLQIVPFPRKKIDFGSQIGESLCNRVLLYSSPKAGLKAILIRRIGQPKMPTIPTCTCLLYAHE